MSYPPMGTMPPDFATIEQDGWTSLSGEEHHARAPRTFHIPDRSDRDALGPGDAAKLLFDIEIREGGRVIQRGVDRMWVIVKKRVGDRYVGVLDNDPGRADGVALRPGTVVLFSPVHAVAIDRPPEGYPGRGSHERAAQGALRHGCTPLQGRLQAGPRTCSDGGS
ncbi:MAG: hypothetical protein ACRENE_30110 [Polyangiaceae bacterium]